MINPLGVWVQLESFQQQHPQLVYNATCLQLELHLSDSSHDLSPTAAGLKRLRHSFHTDSFLFDR